MNKLLLSSKSFQYNTLAFNLTQCPPLTVRKIFSMCCYLKIDIQSEKVWLAMLALCVPSPSGWKVDSCGNYVPASKEIYEKLKQAVPDLPPAPITFNPCDPAILNLQGYTQKNHMIVPHLEEQEA